MDQHLPDLPTGPTPAIRPRSPRPRRPWLIALLACAVLLLLGLGIVALNALFHLSPASPGLGHAQEAVGTSSGQPGSSPAVTGSAPTLQGTPSVPGTTTPHSAPPQQGQPGTTHGRPHLGGPFSDFVGAYGPPEDQGDANTQNFWVGTGQTIDISVLRNAQSVVTWLDALGPNTWNAGQARAYCLPFLPNQAVQSGATATSTTYRSSAGAVVLTWQAHACSLALARS